MRHAATLILLLPLLVGWGSCQRRPSKPEIVTVTVTEIVGVPEDLTRPCYDEPPREQTAGEAKRLANLRRDSLAECSGRMAEIRALGREP